MSKINPEHLARSAFVYVRQSTADQLRNNHESRRRQYALADRARLLGWTDVVVIDDDLGVSADRHFQRMDRVCGHAGAGPNADHRSIRKSCCRSAVRNARRGLGQRQRIHEQSVFDYCRGRGLEQTRSRAYKKNDQAWVEQKNGAVVRRLVGYGRLSGAGATRALAQLYASSRRYINFFQPSFKLKSKTRDGARVHKVYLAPATPCERLLAHSGVEPAIKEKLAAQFKSLDPVRLLQEIRLAQQTLSDLAAHGVHNETAPGSVSEVSVFLASLSLAWKDGEARPTHRKQPTAKH